MATCSGKNCNRQKLKSLLGAPAGHGKERLQASEESLRQREAALGLLRAEIELKAQAEQAQAARARGLQGECSLLERQLAELRDAAKRADLRHQVQVSHRKHVCFVVCHVGEESTGCTRDAAVKQADLHHQA